MTGAKVHIVVTCSNRKTQPVHAELQMRGVSNESIEARFDEWTEKLENSKSTPVTGTVLYSGEHWQVARSLPSIAHASGHQAELWVCSAGYGLVPANALIRPYSATLAHGHPDSIAHTSDEARAWWRMQSTWSGPVSDAPRSLTELAARDPHGTIIAALSATYLAACGDDLLAAAGELSDHQNLTLISAGTRPKGTFADLICPVDGALQSALGGTLMSLNARAASYILTALGTERLNRAAARRVITELGATSLPTERPKREAASDEEIRALIARQLHTGPATYTSMLRQFRSEGRACEQSRFARLYAETKRGD